MYALDQGQVATDPVAQASPLFAAALAPVPSPKGPGLAAKAARTWGTPEAAPACLNERLV